jgi:tetratricopeptide (TPR) repeat protein
MIGVWMSESLRHFVTLIPAWVAATQNIEIVALSEADQVRRVHDLRGRLRDANWKEFDVEANDLGLAVLSRLCFELSNSFSGDGSILDEAVAAYHLVSSLSWTSDQFGERNEILSDLSLVAWRYSRQFGTVTNMLEWEQKYRLAFSQPSAERDYLQQFLATDASERSDQLIDGTLSDISAVFGVCELLSVYRDSCPAKAAAEAAFFYEWLSERSHVLLNGERAHLLGVLALLAGTTHRFLGRRDSAAKWLDKAQSSFSNLKNAEPEVARLAYARLTLCFEHRQFEAVIRELPCLTAQFHNLKMQEEESKCLYVEGMALKESGRLREALAKFLVLERLLSESDPSHLLGGVHLKIGDLYSHRGWHYRAMQEYQRALPLIRESGRSTLSPDFKGTVAETCRNMGQLAIAIELFREAISEYAGLSMNTLAAYLRIVLAETLLLADRPREAEIEILGALPTIEAEQMVEEGFAALNLLRESMDKNKTDAASLRALREHMKGDWQ